MARQVSIGLPVYNGERYLAETLDSILGQDFRDFELIISDNASTDATRDICEAYAQRDSRITYSRLPENRGASRNYNRVFEMSKGKLFKWAAHDDLLHPAFLAQCVRPFEMSEKPPCLVYPKAEFINENGRRIGRDFTRMHTTSHHSFVRVFETLHGMSAVASAVFGVFRRTSLEQTRLIDNFFASDCALLLEIAMLGEIVQLEGKPLFQRRIHPGISTKANLSARDRLRWYDPQARVWISPGAKLLLEYLKSPGRMSHLRRGERALCGSSIMVGVSSRKARVVLGRYRRRLMARHQSTAS